MEDFTDKITIGILDFFQESESRELLMSLAENLLIDVNILFIDNGTPKNYSKQFLNDGLIDELIINDSNLGCGPATVQMYDYCKTPYLIYVQSDQRLNQKIDADSMNGMIRALDEYHCIDLAGNQGNGKFSERANMMKTEFYKRIPKPTLGGPGITNDQKYVEEWVQDFFADNNCIIAHVRPTVFSDEGYYSVRELSQEDPCILKHSCWTKEMWILTDPPKNRHEVYPPLNEEEWDRLIKGDFPRWKNNERGYVPEAWRDNVITNEIVESKIREDIKNDTD
jgi:hypothetical protein